MPARVDPWVAGEPIPGVTLKYNTVVRILEGQHAGEEGWLVALQIGDEPTYTVELMSGNGDVGVAQSSLSNAT